MRGEIIISWYGGLFFWQNKVGIWNGLCYDIFVIFMKRAYCETHYLASIIVQIAHSNADTLSLREKRDGAKLDNTSLSAGVFQGPAYGIYNLHNSYYEKLSFAIT